MTDKFMKKTFLRKDLLAAVCGSILLLAACNQGGEISVERYSEDGISYVEYGAYPQSVVDDSKLIAKLKEINETDERGYFSYNGDEYAKVTAKLVESEAKYTFINGEEIKDEEKYYFKVEPIKWKVISETEDDYQLFSDMALDSQRFDDSLNNYKTSEIRSWLNDDFYHFAFNNAESIIRQTSIDNSPASTGYSSNEYACDDTKDRVYLLSYEDVTNADYGFNNDGEDEARKKELTDYARAKGAYMDTSLENYGNCYWWLRSPYSGRSYSSRYVNQNSCVRYISVTYSRGAVCPALKISK
ncbi:MAG: DUF6273 domain-containing protein [Bacilli bacterium]